MKNKILIVDDTHLYQVMLASVVEKLGFEAKTCGDGAEAIPILTQHHADYVAVLLDIYMPLIDGISTLGHIRSNWPNIQVIVISGSDDGKDEKSARQLGVLGFLKKPLKAETLEEKVEKLLSGLISTNETPAKKPIAT